jgi:transcriptional regulator with XRE-family HTH domain
MTHPLTKYRLKKGLSAEQLAKLAGTTRQTIHRIENGGQNLSLDLLRRVVAATGGKVTANDIIAVENPAKETAA